MNPRLEKIVRDAGVRPDDDVLEIGCGHGIAVELICERLRSGRIVAIDRSAKMIRAAMRRNARHVAAGRVEFHVAELESFGPRQRTFGRELAIRVAIFHREPDRAQALIRRWLKPGARVVSVFDEP